MLPTLSLRALGLLSFVSFTIAACTRESLQSVSDTFFTSSISKNAGALKLSPKVKISQNNYLLKDLSETIFSNMTSMAKPFKIVALDTETCNVSAFVSPKEGTAGQAALTSVRIGLGQTGEISEIEIVNALPGSFLMFLPNSLPEAPSAEWAANEPKPTSHAELAKIVDTYPSGIQAGDGAKVESSATCKRTENGFQMPMQCNSAFGLFKFPVTDRRFVVDTQTGVVQAAFFFTQTARWGASAPDIWMHEYMKVKDGKITEIYAVIMSWKGKFVDVWGPGTPGA